MKVLVLGGTGMLGSMMAKVLPDECEVLVTARIQPPVPYDHVNQRWRYLDVGLPGWTGDLQELAKGCDWIINCLGATKPLMVDPGASQANVDLPAELAKIGVPTVHASTDCVFAPRSGTPAPVESDVPDAADAYGRTKAAGDRCGLTTLRCSIVGPECRSPARHLLGRAVEGRIKLGFGSHLWNGITTLAWTRVAATSIWEPAILGGLKLIHLVPAGSCSKDRLVSTILQAHRIEGNALDVVAGAEADSRLATSHPDAVALLWRAAGYDSTPTIEDLIHEQAEFCRRETWPPAGVDGWRYWRS